MEMLKFSKHPGSHDGDREALGCAAECLNNSLEQYRKNVRE